MLKLPPNSLYRLRCLADGKPRTYQVTAYMRRLEVLGLVEALAGENPTWEHAEYRITPRGLAELAEREHTFGRVATPELLVREDRAPPHPDAPPVEP